MKAQIPATTASGRIAIAVMSFDRPHYLERVLQSVVSQQPFAHLQPDFFLFQDGASSLRSGEVFGDAARLTEAQQVFASYLPQGQVMDSAYNLGVALNFDRAERTLYEELDYDVVLFLEDDLMLQPAYFRTVERLLDLTADRPDIGMVSARGFANDTPLALQQAEASRVVLMDEHNWAFAMRRHAWRRRDRVLRPYLEIMRQVDYRERDKGDMKLALHTLQRALGRYGKGYLTSQDSMKNMAFELLGIHRLTTFVNFGRYIGKEGLHSNSEKFAARGYGRTVVFDRDQTKFDIPATDTLRQMRLGLQYR
jgi:hypothetical protein